MYLFERLGVRTGIDLARLLAAADLAAGLPGAQAGGHVRRRCPVTGSPASQVGRHSPLWCRCPRRPVVFPRYRQQRNWGARLHHVQQHGLEMIVLENEKLRVTIAVGRGADLVEFLYKPKDMDFVWLSANGVAIPRCAA